jgi:hypothetical protein
MQAELSGLTFGVEMETTGLSKWDLAQAVRRVTGGVILKSGPPRPGGCDRTVRARDGRTWAVVSDSSISGVLNGEVVTPILTWEDAGLLRRVADSLRGAGARADRSCGLHVHVGLGGADGRAMANILKLAARMEPYIARAFGIDPRRLDRYCRPADPALLEAVRKARPETRDEMAELWYAQAPGQSRTLHYNATRYHGLNLHSAWYRGTVEYRYFNGTVDGGRVLALSAFCMALTAKGLKARGAQSGVRAFTPESARYDWRVFLNYLGLTGPRWAEAKAELMSAFPDGDAAYKTGPGLRRPRAGSRVAARLAA